MESVIIKDSLDTNRWIIDLDENKNVICIFSRDMGKYFQNNLWCYDYHRYIKVNQKDLNNIGFTLINNKDDWNIINKCYEKLSKLRNKQYSMIYDDKGMLKKKYNNYGVIAYRCCGFIHRKYKTVDYINQLLGIYANKL